MLALRAVPVADEAKVAVRVWAAEAVEVAAAPVPLRVIPVVAEDRVAVAGTAGPEDAVVAVIRTPDTAVEVVAAAPHRVIPAVAVVGKVGQEARARVAVKMRAAGLAGVAVAVDPFTAVEAAHEKRLNLWRAL